MTDFLNLEQENIQNISQRFNAELARTGFKAKSLSRQIGAHENTLGNYVRGRVPDQWVYLARLHEQGIDIRYVLLGIDPDFAGLTSEESLLLKAYRQISPEGQESLLRLAKSYAKDSEKIIKPHYKDFDTLLDEQIQAAVDEANSDEVEIPKLED